MTPQEAIERIKEHTEIHFKKEKGRCPLITEALNMAINSLEKQIPKKPNGIYDENESQKNKKTFHYEQVLIGQCPKCSQEVQEGMNFCMNCGQALDWSEPR